MSFVVIALTQAVYTVKLDLGFSLVFFISRVVLITSDNMNSYWPLPKKNDCHYVPSYNTQATHLNVTKILMMHYNNYYTH